MKWPVIKTLYPLFIVQFFTWLGMFSLWIYCTPVITKYVLGNTGKALDESVFWVGLYFAFYNMLAAFLAFQLPRFIKMANAQIVHGVALILGSVGFSLIYFFKNRYLLFISFAFIAIAWSSIANVPYDMVGNVAPEDKMALYFKIFNFSVVIPQVVAAFLLGWLNNAVFHGESSLIILTGAANMLVAGVLIFFYKQPSKNE